jgi:competence protein ComFC
MYLDFFSDILFPPLCLGCSENIPTGILCPECRLGIELFKTLFCATCGARLPDLKKICHKDAPYRLGTATRYDDAPVQRLIRALKFHGIKAAAKPLAGILIEYITALNLNLNGFTVIPMPISKKRNRGRGFNQSKLIAGYVTEHFSLLLEDNILLRTLHKKPQSETSDLSERKENVRGCFSLTSFDAAQNKNIILLDDVTTSGTTFLEAARVLKEGGAKRIFCLAVAQA